MLYPEFPFSTYIFDLSISMQWCLPCNSRDAGKDHTCSIFSYFPGEFFSCRKLLSKKSIQSRCRPYLSYFLPSDRGNKLSRSKVEVTETRIFLLNRIGKLHGLFANNKWMQSIKRAKLFRYHIVNQIECLQPCPEKSPLESSFRYSCRYSVSLKKNVRESRRVVTLLMIQWQMNERLNCVCSMLRALTMYMAI